MLRPVLIYPHPLLKGVCPAVDPASVEALVTDLIDTMRAHPGCVGLAAPQLGVAARVAVVDVTGHRLAASANGILVLVNPTVEPSHETVIAREGCLSLPTITADVQRPVRAVVSSGDSQVWCDGFEARAVLHEIDHLDGLLILDRVASVRAVFPRRPR